MASALRSRPSWSGRSSATGWQFIDLQTGDVDVHYALPDNRNRIVAFNEEKGEPVDTRYQPESSRIPPQHHFSCKAAEPDMNTIVQRARAIVVTLIAATAQATQTDEFSAVDLAHLKQEYLTVVDQG